MTSSNFPPNSDFKSEIKSLPKLVLKAEAISNRWTMPRRARISMMAFSSVKISWLKSTICQHPASLTSSESLHCLAQNVGIFDGIKRIGREHARLALERKKSVNAFQSHVRDTFRSVLIDFPTRPTIFLLLSSTNPQQIPEKINFSPRASWQMVPTEKLSLPPRPSWSNWRLINFFIFHLPELYRSSTHSRWTFVVVASRFRRMKFMTQRLTPKSKNSGRNVCSAMPSSLTAMTPRLNSSADF